MVSVQFNCAKEVGYFGFLYVTNIFLNGINRKDRKRYLMQYRYARLITLFAASVAAIPLSLAFQKLLTIESTLGIIMAHTET